MKAELFLLGASLGLIDGIFNPCALSVLFFLVAYLFAIASRKKCLIAGFAYSITVFFVYFSFMYGVLNIFLIIGYLEILKMIIGICILSIAILQIKDYFFYGRWIKLEIPKFARPKIKSLIQKSTLPSIILLAFLVSLVEIPCAGGFPLAYLAIIAEKTQILKIFYLAIYNLFFVLPLIFLTLIFYFGIMKAEKAEKIRRKTKKLMRLISGIILFIIALSLLFGLI